MKRTAHNSLIAVVGGGNIAQSQHIPLLVKKGYKISQVIDTNLSVASNIGFITGYPVKICSNIKDLSPRITAAIVASPTAFHYQQVKQLLLKKVHVLCEKPLAFTAFEAEELLSIAKRHNLVLQVGYYRRYHETTQAIRQLIESHDLGKLTECTIFSGSIESSHSLPPSMYNKDISGGGSFIDFGVHLIDRLITWFGPIELTSYADDNQGGLEANCLAELKTKNNIPLKIVLSRTNNLGFYSLLKFSKGYVKVLHNEGNGYYLSMPIESLLGKETPQFWQSLGPVQSTNDYFGLQWDEFMNRINGGAEVHSSLEEAMQTTKLVELAYKKRKPLILSWEQALGEYL